MCCDQAVVKEKGLRKRSVCYSIFYTIILCYVKKNKTFFDSICCGEIYRFECHESYEERFINVLAKCDSYLTATFQILLWTFEINVHVSLLYRLYWCPWLISMLHYPQIFRDYKMILTANCLDITVRLKHWFVINHEWFALLEWREREVMCIHMLIYIYLPIHPYVI